MKKLNSLEIEELRELYLNGWSFNKLANKYNISKTTISFHINKWGISRYTVTVLTEELKDLIQQDYNQGMSIVNICKKYNIAKYRLNFIQKTEHQKLTNYEILKNRRYKIKSFLVNYKGGKCCVCGYDKYIGALDFHHINPNTKDFNISANTSYQNLEILKKEVDKCILVCSNCHREIHAGLIDTKTINNI